MLDSIIDARGRSCPEPVLMTKEAIKNYKEKPITIMVDSTVAVENIKRFAGNQGFHVEVETLEDKYNLIIRK